MNEKQKYEKVLRMFEEPSGAKDKSEHQSDYIKLNQMCNLFVSQGLMTISRGTSKNGRWCNLYQSLKTELTDREVNFVKRLSGVKNELRKSKYIKAGQVTNLSTAEIRQKILDVCANGKRGAEVRLLIGLQSDNAFYAHFRFLRDAGYLEEISGQESQRLMLYRTVEPLYDQGSLREPDVKDLRIKKDEPQDKPKYVNGVMTVKMQHVPRVPSRTGKVHIGSTMGMF